jgi:4'-phosphopantetheinyl transferase
MQPNQTIVYQIPLQLAEEPRSERSLLSSDELSRADRYIVDLPRQQFTACRIALRKILAAAVGCRPAEIRFRYSELGKPSIDTARTPLTTTGKQAAQSLNFNVTHSGNWGLIAVSSRLVGVDIEQLQPCIQARSLKTQVASLEEENPWNSLPASSHAEQIIRLWVCKEALLKAMGLGIAECLQQVSFELPIQHPAQFSPARIAPALQIHLDEPGSCSLHRCLHHSNWTIQTLSIAADYFAAIAILKPPTSGQSNSDLATPAIELRSLDSD